MTALSWKILYLTLSTFLGDGGPLSTDKLSARSLRSLPEAGIALAAPKAHLLSRGRVLCEYSMCLRV